MALPLRIMTRDFELVAEIDSYSSLQIVRSWSGIGSLELRVNRYLSGANELQRGRIVFPYNKYHKAFVIRHREIELDEGGKASENWVIRALPLKSWTSQRLTIPPTGLSEDSIESNAETVLKHYVLNNVINPIDPDDKMPGITVADDLGRGPAVSWKSRYKNLAEELADISLLSTLGWNIDVDIASQQFVFDVREGRDLTVNQDVLPPAIFSPEFNTISNLSYTESELNYQNHAIVAGQGEGVERKIVSLGTATGFDRYTLFVDARDVAEETEGETPSPRPMDEVENDLITRGTQKLTEYQQEVYLEGQVLSSTIERKIPKSINGGLALGSVSNVALKPDGLSLDLLGTYFITQFQPSTQMSQGYNVMPPIPLGSLGQYTSSRIIWDVDKPEGTDLVVEYSLDGRTWSTLENGGSLPIAKGTWLVGTTLLIRQRFFTNDPKVTSTLTDFSYEIRGYQKTNDTIIGVGGLEYEKDFDLGDVVTLQNKEWGVSLDARITEVKEIYEPGGVKIEVTFGNNRPTLITKIKQELSGIRTEITK